MDGVGDSSTVRRILLGSLLRRLRESKNISMREAGYHIRATESKISRLETGKVSFKERDVEDLLTFYGVLDGKERDQVLDLVREANAQGWWHSFSEVLPSWFEAFIGLESAASVVRTYEVQFVPGLLQCPQYVDAVLSSNRAQSATDLHRPIGGPEVMKAQIAYLIEQAERPNITIQLLPYSVGAHAAEGGAFTLLRFAEADLPDVVYLEHLTGAQYIERPEDVEQYARAMDRISVDALHPEATLEALKALLNP